MLSSIKKNEKSYLIILIIVYALSIITNLLANPDLTDTPLGGVILIYYGAALIIIALFTDLIEVTKENILNLQAESSSKFTKRKVLVIVFFSIIIAVRIGGFYFVRQKSGPLIPREGLVFDITRYILGGIAEELLFTGLLYGFLKYKKIPLVLNILIVTVLFTVFHFDFTLGAIMSLVLFRVVVLIGFNYYPSLVFFSIYHILYNSVYFIIRA